MMDTQSILDKISNYKSIIESDSDPELIAKFKKKIDALEAQIAEAENKIEKQEKKIELEEKKELSEVEIKIKNIKEASANEDNPILKAKFEKKIKELEDSLKEVKQEIKEEKKEVSEQKKDIKEAIKKVKTANKSVRKTAIKKVKEVVTEVKKTTINKKKRQTKLKGIMSQIDALINRNKKLKEKYSKSYKKSGKTTDIERDAKRSAKPFGYRFIGKHDYRVPTDIQIKRGLKRGTIDYESRPNRSDVYPDRKVKLADGGMAGMSAEQIVSKKRGQLNSYSDEKVAKIYSNLKGIDYSDVIIELKGNRAERQDAIEEILQAYYRVLVQRPKMADGGMMKYGGQTKILGESGATYKLEMWDSFDDMMAKKNPSKVVYSEIESKLNSDAENHQETKNGASKLYMKRKGKYFNISTFLEDGGMMARGGRTPKRTKDEIIADKRLKALKPGKRTSESGNTYHESRPNRSDVSRKDRLEDGGMMAKGGKVGYSAEDKARKAKPAGWRWKEEAVTKKVIVRKQLFNQPSKKMRDKYPDLVYYEDRLNKSDKNPSSKYQSV